MLPVDEDQTSNDIWDGVELDREQIKLIRLLGTGNFGQVSKAIYGPLQLQVAVKSLKGKILFCFPFFHYIHFFSRGNLREQSI